MAERRKIRIRPPIPEEEIDAALEERAFREEIAHRYHQGSDFLELHPPTKEPARMELAIKPIAREELLAAAEQFRQRFNLQVVYNAHDSADDAAQTVSLIRPGSLAFFEHGFRGHPDGDGLTGTWHDVEAQRQAQADPAQRQALIAEIASDVQRTTGGTWYYQHALFACLVQNGNIFRPADTWVTLGEAPREVTLWTLGGLAAGDRERAEAIIAKARAQSAVSQMLAQAVELADAGLIESNDVTLIRGVKHRDIIAGQLSELGLPATVAATVQPELYPAYRANT